MKVLWWISIFLLVAFPCLGEDVAKVSWFPQEVKQGDVLSVMVKTKAKVVSVAGDWAETAVYFYKQEQGGFAGIAGVDLTTPPGPHRLRVEVKDRKGRSFEQVFEVQVEAGGFEVQRLKLPPEMVDLKGEALSRVLAENKRLMEIFNQVRPERLWHLPFIKPVDGPITGPFGLRRIINGQDRSPHNGVDIAAQLGAKVAACNSGMVAFAQELYLSGKTIIIDHGFGLYSMYFHLSEMRVKEGDAVAIGDCIGLVGATGRVTGPHLHWGIRLVKARVDPSALLRAVLPENKEKEYEEREGL
jgi:murein DD-endopeptidase MepM/ murein hydrolase activator NlpD